MKEVLILAAGQGSKMWPYSTIRNKCTLPVANQTLIETAVKACLSAGVEHIVVAVEAFPDHVRHVLRNNQQVEILEIQETKGSADTFIQGMRLMKSDVVHVLFGDHLIQAEDLIHYLNQASAYHVAISPLRESSSNWIACKLDKHKVVQFGGHHRGKVMTHQMAALSVDRSFIKYAEDNPRRFSELKVGVGSPMESFIEESLNMYIEDHGPLNAYVLKEPFFDLDKPWHVLEANAYTVTKMTQALQQTSLAEGASIDPSARLEGHVQLGKNSHIGRNVWIKGNVIIGDDTHIDQGVIIEGDVLIGNQCSIMNHAKIHSNTCMGHRNLIDQGFEFLGGLTMEHVYMVHYGEYYGMIGENSDIGAGTTSGTLRFDDQSTAHVVKGRKEVPHHFSNCSYLGDYTRTGVAALLMPGVKVGAYSVVGSGVVLSEDVEDKTLIYVEQNLKKRPWGTDKYGW